jgi:phenazine biosynthesis protein phzE
MGNIAQVIISRRFVAETGDDVRDAARKTYSSLLKQRGQYMTFMFEFPSGDGLMRYFVGATPERHLSIDRDGRSRMNPIAGTLKKGKHTGFRARLLEFLRDVKEINECFHVLDEEIKMMAEICPEGGQVEGPFLREIGGVVHTEYELTGRNGRNPIKDLRSTLHAPTLVGGPVESAARIIAKTESVSRGYYGGEIGVYDNGSLDSAIMIRFALIDSDGKVTVQAGAGIVRDSDPYKEAEETRAKASGMIGAMKGKGAFTERYIDAGLLAEVESVLKSRNIHLSRFHLEDQNQLPKVGKLCGTKVVILDNEDNFAHVLKHMATRMGCNVEVVKTEDFESEEDKSDIVILGPGPGDVNNKECFRMRKLGAIAAGLLKQGKPLFAVCLGHQAVAKELGLCVLLQKKSTQGIQRKVSVFGREERVGFYNSFSPVCTSQNNKSLPEDVTMDLDDDGRVLTLSGKKFISTQFHPESILSEHGYEILSECLVRLKDAAELEKENAA